MKDTDRLRWWEDIPLGLALVAQSYVVGLWYYRSIAGAAWQVDLLVAIGAGLALDLIVVTTVMGRRQGRSSGWSWATSLGAFLCSSLIALDRYGWEWRSGLHIAFPLVVFLYSQHLATPLKRPEAENTKTTQTALETLPERSRMTEARESGSAPAAPFQALPQALPLTVVLNNNPAASAPLETVVIEEAHRYHCPHCGEALASKQAVGAAVKNGYCLTCKAQRKAS